jgi:uncharacterized protein
VVIGVAAPAGTGWRQLALAALIAAALTAAVGAQPPPPELTAPVNDFASVVDADSARQLDELIRALRAASGDTVVVATVKTFQPWPDIRSYATRMFENGGRGIGEKGKDNGLLVLLAVDDRQVWVEVGYDLEGPVTDGFAGETSRQVMAPYFRQGDYGAGLLAGTSRIVERIAADRNVTVTGVRVPEAARSARDPLSLNKLILLFVVLFIVLPMINRRSGGRRRRGWRGGVGPWGGGYYGGTWGGGSSWGGSSGGFGGFGGGRSGGGGGGASW